MIKIYTKIGDRGMTATFGGRVAKSDALIAAIGAVDELNSWVGLCRREIFNFQFTIYKQFSKSKFSITQIDQEFKRIQSNLLVIGSSLAGSEKKVSASETAHLEKLIDRLTKDLPKLTNFIYPMGALQVARSVCRRAEREVVAALENSKTLKLKNSKQILMYLNRLSDALFTVGRWVNFKTGTQEEVWRG